MFAGRGAGQWHVLSFRVTLFQGCARWRFGPAPQLPFLDPNVFEGRVSLCVPTPKHRVGLGAWLLGQATRVHVSALPCRSPLCKGPWSPPP